VARIRAAMRSSVGWPAPVDDRVPEMARSRGIAMSARDIRGSDGTGTEEIEPWTAA